MLTRSHSACTATLLATQSRGQLQFDARNQNTKEEPSDRAKFTEDRMIWKNELQRHCEEVYVDPEETIKLQETESRSTRQKETHLQKKGVWLGTSGRSQNG